MIPLITPAAMRDMERCYFDATGTPSIDLMERAARALCEVLLARCGADKTFGFACGPGGNGGDGYACARMIAGAGGAAFIVPARAPSTPDAIENYDRARAAGVREGIPDRPDVWVDALYGTGLSRAPGEASAALIDRMNADRAAGSVVVAVDIPSGLNGQNGRAYAPCVQADLTCTFQYVKPGCVMGDGLDLAGEVLVLDIGIPPSFYPPNSPAMIDADDVRAALPGRARNLHKGNGGHLLIVAGSFGMAGAAALCAQSALRSGAGLVTVACPESIVPILQTLAPCAMCAPMPEKDGALSEAAAQPLEKLFSGKSAVACGCGLSRRASPEVVRRVLECGLPALLDADALNLIAENDLAPLLRPHHLITPHPGEAARLIGRRAEDPIPDAMALRALGCQALLKGAATVVPVGGRPVISTSGTSGMAKGGSGDCLSGLIGALMAQFSRGLDGDALAMLAAVGSELHGVAGEIACKARGNRGMTATDLSNAIPEALKPYD